MSGSRPGIVAPGQNPEWLSGAVSVEGMHDQAFLVLPLRSDPKSISLPGPGSRMEHMLMALPAPMNHPAIISIR